MYWFFSSQLTVVLVPGRQGLSEACFLYLVVCTKVCVSKLTLITLLAAESYKPIYFQCEPHTYLWGESFDGCDWLTESLKNANKHYFFVWTWTTAVMYVFLFNTCFLITWSAWVVDTLDSRSFNNGFDFPKFVFCLHTHGKDMARLNTQIKPPKS